MALAPAPLNGPGKSIVVPVVPDAKGAFDLTWHRDPDMVKVRLGSSRPVVSFGLLLGSGSLCRQMYLAEAALEGRCE
jgi:hypothetical protein